MDPQLNPVRPSSQRPGAGGLNKRYNTTNMELIDEEHAPKLGWKLICIFPPGARNIFPFVQFGKHALLGSLFVIPPANQMVVFIC